MKPVEFDGQNVVFATDQPQYLPLHARVIGDVEGTVVSCWELEPEDLIALHKALVEDQPIRIYLSQLTFGQPLQPQRPSVKKPF